VERFARFSGEPLLFVQGQYGVASDHPDLAVGKETGAPKATATARETLLLSLLFRAQLSVSASFEEHRRAEGINLTAGRVLRSVYGNPGIGADALVRLTFLGERDAEDAIADLTCRSYMVRHADGGLTLTPEGRRLREAMRKRWEEFETQQLASISEEDLTSLQRVLTKLIEQNTSHP
jgi:4-hydroxyphenylacetate 3-hydroxylase, reductase component